MSRRRRSNPLLGRILLISVVVHVIALPVLAKFGAFEKIRQRFATNTVVVIPPAVPDKEKPVEKKEPKKQTPKAAKGAAQAAKSSRQAKNSAPAPPVVAATNTGGPGDAGPTVNPADGTGKVGSPPVVPAGNGGDKGVNGVAGTEPPAKPTVTPVTKPEPKLDTKPEPKVEPKPAVTPHVPVFATAEPTSQIRPEIPDDLRAEALDKTTVVEVSVNADGTVVEAKVYVSSGVEELDQIAVRAAKRWRFHPATRDGEAIASKVRLHIEFKVD